jgi:hypothetical protein
MQTADCSGSLALLHSGCVPRANMRYCVWFLFIPLNALIALLARRIRFQHALEDVSFSRKFFRLGPLAPYEHVYYPEKHMDY